jgi:hypothetical protein
MKQFYQDFRFQRDTLALIHTINDIKTRLRTVAKDFE